ncbi:hypothetical protein ACFU7T_01990 [Streptomyces sp. NPDC057555]|uniref:hypothetical protein n=1 Tax=Streptomyces sp. NPDC057555 TaxID=3346166 RepID=UPI0036C4CD11
MRAWEEALWTGTRWEALLRGVVRRVSAGDESQPWWMPRRALTVVSADVDATAGVAAVWIVWRPKSPRMREHIAFLEWHGEQWRFVGGGSGPAGDDPVNVEVLDVHDSAGALSPTRSSDHPCSLSTGPWIGCTKVHLGRDVGQVLVGARRIEAPEQRRLIAVWTSSRTGRGGRPVIVALGRDGTELSRIGPHDSLDTHTWARLGEE